jgi:hypothetical protein
LSWLRDLFREAAEFEFSTWAGLANIIFGFLLYRRVSITITERLAHAVMFAWESYLTYKARKHGFAYQTKIQTPQPAAREGGFWSTKGLIGVYGLLCVLTIGLMAHYAPPA